ncbi:MAG: hypothetical protein Q7T55_03540 [Solirubrobacteraceae bacterium]|nr:hypothetical protein [Solirubrobacteraceae bacterium]
MPDQNTTTTTTTTTALVDGYLAAYGEPDRDRRAESIEGVWALDGRLVDPPATGEGHDEISALADGLADMFPGHRFRRSSGIDEHHGFARYAWELVDQDGTVALTGSDVMQVGPDGLIMQVVGFFGALPPMG